MNRLPDPKVRFHEGQALTYVPSNEWVVVTGIALYAPRLSPDYKDTVLPARDLFYMVQNRGGIQFSAGDDELKKSEWTPKRDAIVGHVEVRAEIGDRIFIDYGYQVREQIGDSRRVVLNRPDIGGERRRPDVDRLIEWATWFVSNPASIR